MLYTYQNGVANKMNAYVKTGKTRKMIESAKVCTICRLIFTLKTLIRPLYISTYIVTYHENRTVKKVIRICRLLDHLKILTTSFATSYAKSPISNSLQTLQTLLSNSRPKPMNNTHSIPKSKRGTCQHSINPVRNSSSSSYPVHPVIMSKILFSFLALAIHYPPYTIHSYNPVKNSSFFSSRKALAFEKTIDRFKHQGRRYGNFSSKITE